MSFGHKRGWEKRQEERRAFEKKFNEEKRARMAGVPPMKFADKFRGMATGFVDMATGTSAATTAFAQMTSNVYGYSNQIYDMYRQPFGNTITVNSIGGMGSIPVGNAPMSMPQKVEKEVRAPSLREVWAD